MTALLESVTLLIKANFQPERTILLAFGFDEESKGYQGAGHIAPYLNEIYGDDGIMMIVRLYSTLAVSSGVQLRIYLSLTQLDEGGLGVAEKYGKGTIFALPSTAEKGCRFQSLLICLLLSLISMQLAQTSMSTSRCTLLVGILQYLHLIQVLESLQKLLLRLNPRLTLPLSPSTPPCSISFNVLPSTAISLEISDKR